MDDVNTDICFVDQNFLTTFSLTKENILEYFGISKFYDKTCNNEILKMQTQYAGMDLDRHLTSMVGIFYFVEHASEDNTLFIVKKAYNNGRETFTVQMYYIIHGYIYLAPTNLSLHNSRIIEIFWHLNLFLDDFIAKRQFDPFVGFYFSKPKLGTEKTSQEDVKFLLDVLDDFKKRA